MLKTLGRETWNSVKLTLVLLVLCTIIYPLIVWGVGQLAFNKQANGSLIKNSQGQIIGSELIGQQFSRPEYFHGRPSAVGYNAAGSGASNLGPTNPQLLNGNGNDPANSSQNLVLITPGATPPDGGVPAKGTPNAYNVPASYSGIKNYADQFRTDNALAPDTKLPADIVTASGSGLDPNISIDAARLQVNRVTQARKMSGGKAASLTPDQINALIDKNTEGRDLLVLGEPRVNVLKLNLALDEAFGTPPAPAPVSAPAK